MFHFLYKDIDAHGWPQEPKNVIYVQNLTYHNLY